MQLVNRASTDPAYCRARPRVFRRCAGDAGDAVVYEDLLRLAQIDERMATDAESERPANNAKRCR